MLVYVLIGIAAIGGLFASINLFFARTEEEEDEEQLLGT